ncbi:MAG: site-2 protease family protein [Clostridia bacterium]|nr:site-2 protease family protein [Clostridia bacterium]
MDEDKEKNFIKGDNTSESPAAKSDKAKGSSRSFIVFLCVLGGILLFSVIFGLATNNLKGVMGTVGSIALALLVLLVMITVHEFGHYTAGKLLGFGITEFALGFGPAIYRKLRKNGEYFSVRALPIGGFCAFEGEDETSDSPTAFNNRKPWQRIIVLVAGATMNFLLALVIIVMLFGIYGQSLLAAFEVRPDTAYSAEYSLEAGDVIVKLNGKSVYLQTDMIGALKGGKEGEVVPVRVYRNGELREIKVTLRSDVTAENSTDMSGVSRALGIAQLIYIADVKEGSPFMKGDAIFRERSFDYKIDVDDENGNYLKENRIYDSAGLYGYLKNHSAGDEVKLWIFRNGDYYPLSFTLGEGIDGATAETVYDFLGIKSVEYQDRWTTSSARLGFFGTLGGTFVYAFKIAGTIFTVLGELITGALGLKAMGGTVTTIVMTSQAIRVGGFRFLLEIAAYIGVNLAVFNLLPLPALDGSRVVFTLIEMIFRKPVPKKIEAVIHAVGLVLLLGFAVTVDLLHLF